MTFVLGSRALALLLLVQLGRRTRSKRRGLYRAKYETLSNRAAIIRLGVATVLLEKTC
jgi:hypothetical protein